MPAPTLVAKSAVFNVVHAHVDERATLIATVAELHGRATEIVRRMLQDARILADVQQEMSLVLDRLWGLRKETASPDAPEQ